MSKKAVRKCAICKQEFQLDSIEFLKDKGKYIEIECYKQKELNKGLSIDIVNEKINIIKATMKLEQEEQKKKEIEKEQNKLKAKKKEINRTNNRNEFINYIMDTYELTSLPKQFYLKLAEINNGNDKRLAEGITYEDLLIMFKKKKSYLDKVASNNVTKGKEMTGYKRLNYDIAIIINKYDSYKEWKRQQQLLQADIIHKEDILKEQVKIDYSKIKAEQSRNDNEIDITDILDEIY
jgi:hypothetical protein